MELSLSKQSVNISEVFYDAVAEQPIECDVLLPDYCPDIQKVLRCEVVLSLLSHAVSGETFSLDAVATAHLYYLDGNGCLRHAEYKIPYTKTIELRTAPQNPAVTVSQNVDYFNCRAVSQRRLDMRGAISIRVKVTGQSEEEVICGAEGMGVQLRCEAVENTVMLPPVKRQVRVYEEVELGHGKPSIGGLLRYSATTRATEWKVVSGKLITKGEVTVHILYQGEEDDRAVETMEYSLAVSQVIDMAGVEEDCDCFAWYETCGLEISSKRDVGGENRIFAIEVMIGATAGASRRMAFEAAGDSYSTECECKQTVKQIPFLELVDRVSESYVIKETLELPSEIRSVIDLWCTPGATAVRMEQDAAAVSGKLTIKMFAYDMSGEIVYYEQMRDMLQRVPVRKGCEAVQFAPRLAVEGITFTISGAAQLEVRCSMRVDGEIYNQFRKQVICDLSVDESRKKQRRDNMLYLYYADAEESIWEVAKRYNTSADVIRRENGLENAVSGERTMLLIPMK